MQEQRAPSLNQHKREASSLSRRATEGRVLRSGFEPIAFVVGVGENGEVICGALRVKNATPGAQVNARSPARSRQRERFAPNYSAVPERGPRLLE